MVICETCDYANRPPYKSPCSECDKTMGSPFCCYEHEEKPTNADRIRAMSDEELAKFITHPCECSVDPETDGYRECGNNLCIAYLLKWLKQPSEEGADNG